MHTATLYKDVTCSSPKARKSLVITSTLGLLTAADEEEEKGGGGIEFNLGNVVPHMKWCWMYDGSEWSTWCLP